MRGDLACIAHAVMLIPETSSPGFLLFVVAFLVRWNRLMVIERCKQLRLCKECSLSSTHIREEGDSLK